MSSVISGTGGRGEVFGRRESIGSLEVDRKHNIDQTEEEDEGEDNKMRCLSSLVDVEVQALPCPSAAPRNNQPNIVLLGNSTTLSMDSLASPVSAEEGNGDSCVNMSTPRRRNEECKLGDHSATMAGFPSLSNSSRGKYPPEDAPTIRSATEGRLQNASISVSSPPPPHITVTNVNTNAVAKATSGASVPPASAVVSVSGEGGGSQWYPSRSSAKLKSSQPPTSSLTLSNNDKNTNTNAAPTAPSVSHVGSTAPMLVTSDEGSEKAPAALYRTGDVTTQQPSTAPSSSAAVDEVIHTKCDHRPCAGEPFGHYVIRILHPAPGVFTDLVAASACLYLFRSDPHELKALVQYWAALKVAEVEGLIRERGGMGIGVGAGVGGCFSRSQSTSSFYSLHQHQASHHGVGDEERAAPVLPLRNSAGSFSQQTRHSVGPAARDESTFNAASLPAVEPQPTRASSSFVVVEGEGGADTPSRSNTPALGLHSVLFASTPRSSAAVGVGGSSPPPLTMQPQQTARDAIEQCAKIHAQTERARLQRQLTMEDEQMRMGTGATRSTHKSNNKTVSSSSTTTHKAQSGFNNRLDVEERDHTTTVRGEEPTQLKGVQIVRSDSVYENSEHHHELFEEHLNRQREEEEEEEEKDSEEKRRTTMDGEGLVNQSPNSSSISSFGNASSSTTLAPSGLNKTPISSYAVPKLSSQQDLLPSTVVGGNYATTASAAGAGIMSGYGGGRGQGRGRVGAGASSCGTSNDLLAVMNIGTATDGDSGGTQTLASLAGGPAGPCGTDGATEGTRVVSLPLSAAPSLSPSPSSLSVAGAAVFGVAYSPRHRNAAGDTPKSGTNSREPLYPKKEGFVNQSHDQQPSCASGDVSPVASSALLTSSQVDLLPSGGGSTVFLPSSSSPYVHVCVEERLTEEQLVEHLLTTLQFCLDSYFSYNWANVEGTLQVNNDHKAYVEREVIPRLARHRRRRSHQWSLEAPNGKTNNATAHVYEGSDEKNSNTSVDNTSSANSSAALRTEPPSSDSTQHFTSTDNLEVEQSKKEATHVLPRKDGKEGEGGATKSANRDLRDRATEAASHPSSGDITATTPRQTQAPLAHNDHGLSLVAPQSITTANVAHSSPVETPPVSTSSAFAIPQNIQWATAKNFSRLRAEAADSGLLLVFHAPFSQPSCETLVSIDALFRKELSSAEAERTAWHEIKIKRNLGMCGSPSPSPSTAAPPVDGSALSHPNPLPEKIDKSSIKSFLADSSRNSKKQKVPLSTIAASPSSPTGGGGGSTSSIFPSISNIGGAQCVPEPPDFNPPKWAVVNSLREPTLYNAFKVSWFPTIVYIPPVMADEPSSSDEDEENDDEEKDNDDDDAEDDSNNDDDTESEERHEENEATTHQHSPLTPSQGLLLRAVTGSPTDSVPDLGSRSRNAKTAAPSISHSFDTAAAALTARNDESRFASVKSNHTRTAKRRKAQRGDRDTDESLIETIATANPLATSLANECRGRGLNDPLCASRMSQSIGSTNSIGIGSNKRTDAAAVALPRPRPLQGRAARTLAQNLSAATDNHITYPEKGIRQPRYLLEWIIRKGQGGAFERRVKNTITSFAVLSKQKQFVSKRKEVSGALSLKKRQRHDPNPIPHSPEDPPVFIIMGGGMAAGKTTATSALESTSWWRRHGNNAVVIDADEFKFHDPLFKANSPDLHRRSVEAAEQLLVDSLNEGRDIVFDGTMSWLPYVQQTFEMVRDAHRFLYKRCSVAYRPKEGLEEYWERLRPRETLLPAPYVIKFVGITVDPSRAVQRGILRRVNTGRSVPVKPQLRSFCLFSQGFLTYAAWADSVVLYNNNVRVDLSAGQLPKIIAEKHHKLIDRRHLGDHNDEEEGEENKKKKADANPRTSPSLSTSARSGSDENIVPHALAGIPPAALMSMPQNNTTNVNVDFASDSSFPFTSGFTSPLSPLPPANDGNAPQNEKGSAQAAHSTSLHGERQRSGNSFGGESEEARGGVEGGTEEEEDALGNNAVDKNGRVLSAPSDASTRLIIHDPVAFKDFLYHSHINQNATSEEDLWLAHRVVPDWEKETLYRREEKALRDAQEKEEEEEKAKRKNSGEGGEVETIPAPPSVLLGTSPSLDEYCATSDKENIDAFLKDDGISKGSAGDAGHHHLVHDGNANNNGETPPPPRLDRSLRAVTVLSEEARRIQQHLASRGAVVAAAAHHHHSLK